jgi:hypothetical protein
MAAAPEESGRNRDDIPTVDIDIRFVGTLDGPFGFWGMTREKYGKSLANRQVTEYNKLPLQWA